jgi:hypothetical protein
VDLPPTTPSSAAAAADDTVLLFNGRMLKRQYIPAAIRTLREHRQAGLVE